MTILFSDIKNNKSVLLAWNLWKYLYHHIYQSKWDIKNLTEIKKKIKGEGIGVWIVEIVENRKQL